MSKDSERTKLCFVIGPIGDQNSETRIHADWVLNGIIKPVMSEFPDFTVKRADEDPRPGLIDAHMINDLLMADLVIADLSFLNPNAFYEIGIRHMAQKPIVHMQLASEQIPFDLSLYRAVKFSRVRYNELEVAKVDLKRAVAAVLTPDYVVENPVTNARGKIRLQEGATPAEKVLTGELEALRERLTAVERNASPAFIPPIPVLSDAETLRMVRAGAHLLRGAATHTPIPIPPAQVLGLWNEKLRPGSPTTVTQASESAEQKPSKLSTSD
jgi:hypothetical protein